jgi:hypothetical protein
MSVLEASVFFGGEEDIDGDDLASMEVGNFSTDIDLTLSHHFGWKK